MLGNLAKNFSFVVLGRIGSRIADFVLKILIVRSLNPKIFASTVHFQLILNVSLFYIKNCFKNCYQKQSHEQSQSLVLKNSSNLMLLGVPITFLFAGGMVLLQIIFNSDCQNLEYFALTSGIYGMSCVLESIYEVAICKLVLQSNYQKMTQIEIISLLFKSVVMWMAVYLDLFKTYGVLIFGLSQVTYSFMLMVFGIMTSPESLKLSQISKSGEFVSKQLKQLVKQFTLVNLIKLLMQQVEKIVMVVVNDVDILSVFTLVSNLGSIIPRFVFQPLQQIAYNIFAKSKNNAEVKLVLEILLKILVAFGSILVVFGTLYSQSLLSLLYGQTWSTQSAISALSSYCLYTLLMGVNGICEAFVYARIQPQHIGRFRNYMVVGTIIYVASAVLSIIGGYGASGIFLSSCLGMMFRVFICWKIFISKLYTFDILRWVNHIIIKKIVFFVYFVSFIVLYPFRNRYHPFINLAIGGIVALIDIGITAVIEKETFNNVRNITNLQNKIQ